MIPRDDALQTLREKGFLLLDFAGNITSARKFVESLGALMPQYDKGVAWNVKPREGHSKMKNSLGKAGIAPHTEFYETSQAPPKYVALYCVEKASCGGGAIAVADMRGYLTGMDPDLKARLIESPFTFSSEPGLRSFDLGSEAVVCALSHDDAGDPVIRFCTKGILGGDQKLADEYKTSLLRYFTKHRQIIRQEPGSLLVWDNHICVHARATKFRCKKRHLVRYWVSGEKDQPVGKKFKAGIMFADVRGYSKLDDKEAFHTVIFNELLEEAMARSGVNRFRELNLWGDGVFCCHDDLGKLASFAVNLTRAFDDFSLKGGPILRLRTALHYGEIQANDISLNGTVRNMHYGSDIVTPARLEPVVEPGQVWCTTEAAKRLRTLPTRPPTYSLQALPPVTFAKDHGTHFTYWLRKDRKDEEKIKDAEDVLASKLKGGDLSSINMWCDDLLELADGDFSPPSRFVTWEKLLQRLLYAGACKKALLIIDQYSQWLTARNLMTVDSKDLLLCMALRAQKFTKNKERDPDFRRKLDELVDRSTSSSDVRNETLLVIADALMSLGLTADDTRSADRFLSLACSKYVQMLAKPQAAMDEEQRNGMRFVGVSYYAEGSRSQYVTLALWSLASHLNRVIVTPNAPPVTDSSTEAASALLKLYRIGTSYREPSVSHPPINWASFAISALVLADQTALSSILDLARAQESAGSHA